MPRRRRGAAAIALDEDTERGFVTRVLLHSPKDTVAGLLAFAAIVAIVANALFLQAGRHPSPMFGSIVTLPAADLPSPSPLPRPRSADAALASPVEAKAADSKAVETRPVEAKPAEPKTSEPKTSEPRASEPRAAVESKPADPMTNLVKATSTAPAATSSIPRPPAPIPVARNDTNLSPGGSRRIAAVQRALTEYGYGQLKPTGTIGSDTQAAIVKFERERKIPATGQISERMVRELVAMIGHPID
jgi:hypothetical protein